MKSLSDQIEEEKESRSFKSKLKKGFEEFKMKVQPVTQKLSVAKRKSLGAIKAGGEIAAESYKAQVRSELGRKYKGFKKNPFKAKGKKTSELNLNEFRFSSSSFLFNGPQPRNRNKKRLVIKL